MSAGDHLSSGEFPREEVEKWIDPAMDSWDKVHSFSKGYIERVLGPDIAQHGIQKPIEVDRESSVYTDGEGWAKRPKIYDGHHRVESARMLGIDTIPVRFRGDED